MTRRAKVERKTKESDIVVEIDLDGTGQVDIDTGVPNRLLRDGSTMADAITDATAAARNQRQFVDAVAGLAEGWRREGLNTQAQKDAIVSAAAGLKSQ